jgi:hypothetical protein
MSAIASLAVAKLQPTCPGLESGDCDPLHWDDAGNVTARDTRTGEVQTLAMEWDCPVIEAARRGKKE